MENLKISINTHDIDKLFEKKARDLDIQTRKLTDELLGIIQRSVREKSPQKKGLFKKSIIKEVFTPYRGAVYQDEKIAPYGSWVIDGRGPVYPRRKKALHFFVGGVEVFAKSAGPAKGYEPFDKAKPSIDKEVDARFNLFVDWLTN